MKAKIVSLNIGEPAQMEWEGKSVLSSMVKRSVAGPLVVHKDRIEGNSFASPQFHGTIDSVLYALGLSSAEIYMKELGAGQYLPGTTGETVTLDHFDESEISAGDIFRFGEVVAQATFPRIPCGKLMYRMQNARGQKAMQECGRSGVYFRILSPGKIHTTDVVERIEKSAHPVIIAELYRKIVKHEKLSPEELAVARANGSIPERVLAKVM